MDEQERRRAMACVLAGLADDGVASVFGIASSTARAMRLGRTKDGPAYQTLLAEVGQMGRDAFVRSWLDATTRQRVVEATRPAQRRRRFDAYCSLVLDAPLRTHR